ncbi:PREDICTED: gastrokine-1-like, partial [Galeopterus variegatus]|uniref:Gastrokine-1-like n=1 Tax=Galeopterus variegatus TaxID=482537 RepID=A0ABM0Q4K7_GALVR
IVFAGLLGVFLAPAIADYNINVSDDDNSAGSGQQTVSVNNEHNVANIDNNNGDNPWNSIWDYGSVRASLFYYSEKCFNTNILWILNISFCGETVEN